MGWLFTYGKTKAELIKELTAPEENETRRWATIAHCVRGNVLWSVIEITYTQEHRTKRLIVCNLLARQKDCGWGYKDMDESMHPFFYSCPLKYLDLVPIERFGGHPEWRGQVHEYHARIALKRHARKAARQG